MSVKVIKSGDKTKCVYVFLYAIDDVRIYVTRSSSQFTFCSLKDKPKYELAYFDLRVAYSSQIAMS
jgi:hypothetical protein